MSNSGMRLGTKVITVFITVVAVLLLSNAIGIVQLHSIMRDADLILEEEFPIVVDALNVEGLAQTQLHTLHAFLVGEKEAAKEFESACTAFNKLIGDLSKEAADHQDTVEKLKATQALLKSAADDAMKYKTEADEKRAESVLAMEEMDVVISGFLAKMTAAQMNADRVNTAWAEIMAAHDFIIHGGSAEERGNFQRLRAQITNWPDYSAIKTEHEALVASIEKVLGLFDKSLKAKADMDEAMHKTEEHSDDLITMAEAFVGDTRKSMAAAMLDADNSERAGQMLSAVFGIVALVLAVFAGSGLIRLVRQLREQNVEMLEGVNVLASSVGEISAAVSQLASGASETASSVAETTTTIEEVKQTSQVATEKAKMVSDGAQKTLDVSRDGEKAATQTREEIDRIKEQMDAIADSVVRLSEQSQLIGDIISSVDDLSEQSNLLAVNAAVEAAKAGEQGKGFAVVAQEIRSLAEQSKQSTTQVRSILNDIQKAVSAAVMSTEQGSKAVDIGVVQAQEARDAIQGLSQSVGAAAQAATQIAAASQQQFVGVDQVTTAMENIKEASDQNVESTRQLETLAGSLKDLGERLKALATQHRV